MKKYLITGALALVACATLTSCHSDDELSGSIIEQKMKAYEQVFEEEFGKVDPNQDWGFGTAEILARTRAAMARTRADGKFATTSGAYTNANMWAEDFVVPTQLTPGQKLRVQKYFQTHKNPGSAEEKTITDFFVQQVYDGFDDPMEGTDPATGEPYSPEQYLAADGRTNIQSGDHMDHLIVGGNHINNFNNATYGTNGAPNTNVQNSTGENYWNADFTAYLSSTSTEHSDQIQLMLNTTAYPWSYANSDASYVRDNRWTLVSAAVIDEWGRAAGIGEDVTDKWNRSFIGFDFDQLPDKNCYTGTTAYYGDANARYNDLVYTLAGEITAITNGDTKIIVDEKEIPYLITDQNEYCGDFVGVGGMDNLNDYALEGAYVEGGDNDNTLYLNTLPGEQSDHKALNMNFIAKMVRAGYLPVSGKNLRKWVRIGGCNDGYYTDWIVSFMPAIPVGDEPDPTTYTLRVMAEDLSATEKSDFDFNDVVFDVEWEIGTTSATITLLAAGGTLPLRIAGRNDLEVHGLFGVDTNVMVNTGWSGSNGANNVPEQTFTLSFNPTDTDGNGEISQGEFNAAVNGILVEVEKVVDTTTGAKQWFPLTANEGEACCKFGCDPDFEWVPERTPIDDVYTFSEWVEGFTATLERR